MLRNREEINVKLFHLVRHAETIWNSDNRYAGQINIDLNENGKKQAQDLIVWANKVNPIAIYSSDLSRAIDTASPMSEKLKLELNIDSRLREISFGEIEGLNPKEMESEFWNIRQEYLHSPATVLFPNGESGVIALSRARPAIMEILNSYDSGSIILVSHGSLMRIIACDLMGLNINLYRKIFPRIQNSGIISLLLNSKLQVKEQYGTAGLLELK